MWGCNLGLNCNIISYSDDIMIRSEELISRSDDVISRSDDKTSHFGFLFVCLCLTTHQP